MEPNLLDLSRRVQGVEDEFERIRAEIVSIREAQRLANGLDASMKQSIEKIRIALLGDAELGIIGTVGRVDSIYRSIGKLAWILLPIVVTLVMVSAAIVWSSTE